jgi:hypothetical protein
MSDVNSTQTHKQAAVQFLQLAEQGWGILGSKKYIKLLPSKVKGCHLPDYIIFSKYTYKIVTKKKLLCVASKFVLIPLLPVQIFVSLIVHLLR